MKKLSFLLTFLLIGMVGFAADVVLFEQTFPGNPSKYSNNYQSSFTVTTSGNTLTYTNFNNGGSGQDWVEIRCGRKNNASVATITTGLITETISKAVVNITQIDASKINSISMTVASDANFSEDVQNIAIASSAYTTGEMVFSVENPAANRYYEITFDLKSSSANGFVRLDNVTFYTVTADVEATDISLDESAIELEQYDVATLTATLTPEDATTAVEWTSDNEEVATVTNGKVTAIGVGSATITASAGEGVTATCEVTVSELQTTLSCAVAAVKAMTVSGNNVEFANGTDFTVEGYVTEIASAYSESYNNLSVWMADEADGGQVLEAYRAVPTGDVPVVGDKVRVVGKLTKYNSTPEFAAGASITVINDTPEYDTVYFVNQPEWDEVHIYLWNNESYVSNSWPGVLMDLVEDVTVNGYDVYSYAIDKSLTYNMCIFGNGQNGGIIAGYQTPDLEINAGKYFYDAQYEEEGNYPYSFGYEVWYNSIEDIPALPEEESPIVETYFNTVGWAGVETESYAEYDSENETVTVHIASQKNDQWQAQVKLMSPIEIEADAEYNVSFTLNSTMDMSGVTFMFQDNAQMIYLEKSITLVADEDYNYATAEPVAGQVGNNVMVFDFGFAPAGAVITISNIVVEKVEEVATYYVAGNGADDESGVWCDGKFWDPAGSPMYDNTITFHLTDTVMAYAFKLTEGSWATEFAFGYVSEASKAAYIFADNNDENGNIKFYLAEECDVTISFDGSEITVTGSFRDPNAVEISTYTIVGAAAMMGTDNDDEIDEANDMILSEGVYTLSLQNVELEAGYYTYKVIGNHNPMVYELPRGATYQFAYIEEAGIYNLTFTFSPANEEEEAHLYYSAVKVNEGTGVAEQELDASATKILRNGEILIHHAGQTYTVQGVVVK